MYALADCNNFFVSCERVFRPDLWDKPVVVLSGNDGCVVARSNEVKALGIKMGTPLYQVRHLVETHHITCFSSNFSLYSDISNRVMSLLRRHTPQLEQYSVDECFLHIDHINSSTRKSYFEQVVREVYQGIGIPISVGIAPTKTLAKVASKYAKQYPGYHGVCVIDSEERRVKALHNFPIDDVWGVGRQAYKKLSLSGISTALEFAERSESFARQLLHKPGWLVWRELNGYDCISTADLPAKQSITVSRTFAHPVTDQSMLEQAMLDFCDSAARKLRLQHTVCHEMQVFAQTSRFQTERCVISATVTFPIATANTQELMQALLVAVREQWQQGAAYKRAGVILSQIEGESGVQQSLFDERDRQRDKRLQTTIDRLNDRLGRHTMIYAGQMTDKTLYEMGRKSPNYTTNISDLLRVKA